MCLAHRNSSFQATRRLVHCRYQRPGIYSQLWLGPARMISLYLEHSLSLHSSQSRPAMVTWKYMDRDGVLPSESASNLLHTNHTLGSVNGSGCSTSHYFRTGLRPTLELSRKEWLPESIIHTSLCSCPLSLGPIADFQIYWSVQLFHAGK